jgi:hypothetical protein
MIDCLADDYTRRAKLIERLHKESDVRTQHLLDVQTTLKSAETVLTNCVFQVGPALVCASLTGGCLRRQMKNFNPYDKHVSGLLTWTR